MKHLSQYLRKNRPEKRPTASGSNGEGAEIYWAARLHPGERLLWSGQPEPGERSMTSPAMDTAQRLILLMVCIGVVSLLLYTVLPAISADPLILGLVMTIVALIAFGLWYMLGGQAHWNRYWLRRTRYALTDRRAIFARRALWRYWTRSIPLAKMTPVRLVDLGGVGHVVFQQFGSATSYSTISKGMVVSPRHYATGFQYLRDAAGVHRRLAALQSAASGGGAVQTRTGPVA